MKKKYRLTEAILSLLQYAFSIDKYSEEYFKVFFLMEKTFQKASLSLLICLLLKPRKFDQIK